MAEQFLQPQDPTRITWRVNERLSATYPEFTGDDLIVAAFNLVDAHPGLYSLAARHEAALSAIDIAERARTGEPVLLLAWDYEEQRYRLDDIAVVEEPPVLSYRTYGSGWGFRMRGTGGRPGNRYTRSYHISFEDLLEDCAGGYGPAVVAGQDNAHLWLREHALTMLQPSHRRPDNAVSWDAAQIRTLANANIPANWLGLDASQLQYALDAFSANLLDDEDLNMMRAIKYLAHYYDTEDEKVDADEVLLRLATRYMPYAWANLDVTERLMSFANDVWGALDKSPITSYYDARTWKLYNREGYAAVLSRMYSYLAQELAGNFPQPERTRPLEEYDGQAPPLRQLRIADGHMLSDEIRAENDYVSQLRHSGRAAQSLNLNYHTLRFIGDNLSRLIMESTDLEDHLDIIANLEYLFEVGGPEHNDGRAIFYDELRSKLAKWVPLDLEPRRALEAHLVAARAIAIMFPEAASDSEGNTYYGDAAVAAIVGDFYYRKHQQMQTRLKYGNEGDLSYAIPFAGIVIHLPPINESPSGRQNAAPTV